MRTKAAPTPGGRCLRRSVTAASPPADAPTPTTRNDDADPAAEALPVRFAAVPWKRVDLLVDLRRDFFTWSPFNVREAHPVVSKVPDFNISQAFFCLGLVG